ncbi:MAG: hypothetical protein U9O89_05505 [Thermoproteota archaeon]|nr:hypothetical protein [Thermoproteota archaeon]
MNKNCRLVVTVKRIRGRCPVFKVGDRNVIEEPKIVLEKRIIFVFMRLEAYCQRLLL